MTYFYIVPSSFLKFSIAMQILFALVSLLVAYFSFKIYKLSRQREIRLFGISFFFISLSYIILAMIHLSIVSPVIIKIAKLTTENISRLGGIAILLHTVIFITGLITLVYTTLKLRSTKVYYLLLGLALVTIIIPLIIMVAVYEPAASRSLYTLIISFRLLSVFILAFVIYNYLEEYARNRNKKTMLIAISFALLLISNADFIFSVTYYQAYIIGNILEFIAYLFILISLVLSIKK